MHKPHSNRVQQFGDSTLVRNAPAHPMFFLQRKSGRAFEIRSYNFVQKGEHAARNSLSLLSVRTHARHPMEFFSLRPGYAPKGVSIICVGNLDHQDALDAGKLQRDERNVLSALQD